MIVNPNRPTLFRILKRFVDIKRGQMLSTSQDLNGLNRIRMQTTKCPSFNLQMYITITVKLRLFPFNT